MGAKAYLVSEVIDVAITALLGDKVSAEKQRIMNRVIERAVTGEITDKEAYEMLKFKDGDSLDQKLGHNVLP